MAKKKIDTATVKPDIIIANPVYDAVFKHLITTKKGANKDIAGYFVGTVLGEKIADIDFQPTEYTYQTKPKPKEDGENPSVIESLKLMRLDFVATIRTKSGEHKKVLVEIQKSNKPTDQIRFRTYLGEQYKKVDTINKDGERVEEILPIVTIYMLGFTHSDNDPVVLYLPHSYIDLINGVDIKTKTPYVENLIHDAYFIYIPNINRSLHVKWEDRSELEQMLSLFEQDHFVEENILKKYPYPITNPNIKKMIDTLEFLATDPEVKRSMMEEFWDAQNEAIWENRVKTQANEIAAQAKAIEIQINKNVKQAKTIKKQANENKMLANEKATLANEKAMLTNEKAMLANEKATLTNEKAMLANEKAMLANENTKQAKTIKKQANEKATLANEKATLSNENKALSSENAELRRMLQQAGIIPFD